MNLNSGIYRHAQMAAFMVIAINLVGYIMGVEAMSGAWVGGGGFLVTVAAMIAGSIAVRKEEGGVLSYGRAWIHMMVVWLAVAVVTAVYTIVLFTIFDPGVVEPMVNVALERAEEMMSLFKNAMPESEYEQAMADAELRTRQMFTAIGQVKVILWGGLFWGVLSLLLALTVWRREVRKFN